MSVIDSSPPIVGLMKPSKSDPIAVYSWEPEISATRSRCRQITSNESSKLDVVPRRTPSLS